MDRIPEFSPNDSPDLTPDGNPTDQQEDGERPLRWKHLSSVRMRFVFLSLLAFVLVIATLAYAFTGSLTMPVRYAALVNKPAEQKIRIPIRGIQPRQIENTWQARRGADRKHEGQDIFAPKGTPIYSATEGYIVQIGENSLGGKTVSVLGAGGRVYYYAHLDRYADNISEGDLVTTESVLGYVGNTGNARTTRAHLHFGVYTASGPVDPLSLF